jgi:hypothetical protein
VLPASNQTCRYSQRIVELNLRIGQCVSDLTLHLQLHSIESGAGGMQRLQDAVDALRLATPSTSSAHSSQALEAECSVDRGALCIDMDFSGQRKVLCSLNDALIMFGRYEGQPVLVMEASAAAVHCIRAQQQQGTGPSLPRLLRDLTNVVHPNIVEVKGGYIAQPPAAPLTLVLEPFDQLLPAALRCPCSGTQKLAASVDICRGLSFLQSISRRFLLVPERVCCVLRIHLQTSAKRGGRCSAVPMVTARARRRGLGRPLLPGRRHVLIWSCADAHVGRGGRQIRPLPFERSRRNQVMRVTLQLFSYSLFRRCRVALQRVQLGQPHPFVKDVAALPHVPKVQNAAVSRRMRRLA